MKPLDNAKVMETLEKQTLYNYLERLINTKMRKITLFPIFPYTAAANISDPHNYVIIEDLSSLVKLNSGNFCN